MADFQTNLPVTIVQEDGDYMKVMVVGDVSQTEIWRNKRLSSTRSFNNRLVVEAYQKTGLQTTVNAGFAFIQQKVTVKGLEVLMDAQLADGTFVPKGSIAYIKEELLHTSAWAQKILESDTFERPFIIVDMTNVEYISPPKGTAA
jgi:hypothetical protein